MVSKATFIFGVLVLCATLNSVFGSHNFLSRSADTDDAQKPSNETLPATCPGYVGCLRGYCWAYCDGYLPHVFGEWCWTTRGEAKDGQYIKCKEDDECSTCFKCAGRCSIIF